LNVLSNIVGDAEKGDMAERIFTVLKARRIRVFRQTKAT
jgi:hypothetical protein